MKTKPPHTPFKKRNYTGDRAMSDYDVYYEMEIEKWAERRNEAALCGSDDYPTQPAYRPKLTAINKEEPKGNSIEDAIAWLDKWSCPF